VADDALGTAEVVTPGNPWGNGYGESVNGTLRDECLNGERFYVLTAAQIVIAQWRVQYHSRRPHASLGGRRTAPEAYDPVITTNAIPRPMAVTSTPTLPGTKPRSGQASSSTRGSSCFLTRSTRSGLPRSLHVTPETEITPRASGRAERTSLEKLAGASHR